VSLGGFIKSARRGRGLTQKELADRARVPTSTIQAMEQDKVLSIRLETARRLARVLGVTIDEIAEAARESREGQFEPAVA
jgi:transcriptional regulator with XRE-family HTH domain